MTFDPLISRSVYNHWTNCTATVALLKAEDKGRFQIEHFQRTALDIDNDKKNARSRQDKGPKSFYQGRLLLMPSSVNPRGIEWHDDVIGRSMKDFTSERQ